MATRIEFPAHGGPEVLHAVE
ncbi:molecular chaperone GroES, partial [Klebsiella aerogenes]